MLRALAWRTRQTRAFTVSARKHSVQGEWAQATRPAPGTSDDDILTECEWEGLRRGGPGGQRRNKAETGVRLEHKPTGVRAEATGDRTQAGNWREAIKRLKKAIAMEVREAPFSPSEKPPKELEKILKRQIGPNNTKFSDGLGPLLDVIEHHGGVIKDAASHMGTTTGSLNKVLSSDSDLLTAVNRIRERNGFKPLRSVK